jgi:hypothetical protein
MRKGRCKLCLQQKELRRSHFLPTALYSRKSVIMNRKVSLITSRQIADYVLCADCELRFSKNGETWYLSQVSNPEGFPLLDRLKVAVWIHPLLPGVYSAQAVGIDTGKLGYFVLSVLWRASVHTWRLYGQELHMGLGEFEEPVRLYLVGASGFPHNVFITAGACTDRGSQGMFFVPSRLTYGALTAYGLLTNGIYSRTWVGSEVPAQIRENCCVTSDRKPIFTGSCEDNTISAFQDIYRETKVARNLRAL